MNLNENDARAVDILLNGMPQGLAAMDAADGKGVPGTSRGGGSGFGSTRSTSAMSDDLAEGAATRRIRAFILVILGFGMVGSASVQPSMASATRAAVPDTPGGRSSHLPSSMTYALGW